MVSASVFGSWLKKGLGQAGVFLEEHDPAPYFEVLLHACLHNATYDAQCECSRISYLWQLIELSRERPFFRDGLMRCLQGTVDDPKKFDWEQVFGLARHFAAVGDGEMRAVMYSAFERLGFEVAGSAAGEFISLDGLDGFVFAASYFDGEQPSPDVWDVRKLISDLEEQVGEKRLPGLLDEAARRNPRTEAAVNAARNHKREHEKAREVGEAKPAPDYETLRARKADLNWASEFRLWARDATAEEILIAGDDFLQGADEAKLLQFLRALHRRPFPGSPDRLLALSDDERKHIRWAAVLALEKICQPNVRRRALELLGSPDRFEDGARMLVSNYQSGDFRILNELLRRSLTDEEFHELGFSVQALLDRELIPGAEELLLLLYEKGPCSNCHEDVVEFLIEMDKVPEWMRRECQFDANVAIGELVRR